MNEENRKFKRYDVDSIHGRLLVSSDINILNISMDGAAIATTQRLVMGRTYSLKLKFEEKMLNLKGKVVWSVLSHSMKSPSGDVMPVYKAGIRFTNTLTGEAEHLISYIEKNKAGSMGKRVLGVRFKLHSHDASKIDMQCEYEIKRISLSGMLIETDMALAVESVHEMELNIDGTVISVAGRIVNATEIRQDDTMKYHIGIEFIKISENDLCALSSYLQTRDSDS